MRLCKAEKIIRKKRVERFYFAGSYFVCFDEAVEVSKLTTELTTLCAKLFTFEIFENKKRWEAVRK